MMRKNGVKSVIAKEIPLNLNKNLPVNVCCNIIYNMEDGLELSSGYKGLDPCGSIYCRN